MPSQTFFNLPIEKQERIMNAAIHEMGLHTLEQLNIAHIINDAKIPRGSFYQYFKDKFDLYDYFYNYIAQRKMEFYGNLLSPEKDLKFIDRVLQIYIKGFEFALKNPDLVLAGRMIMMSDRYQQQQMTKAAMEQSIQLFEHFIIEDQKKDLIRQTVDPKMLATVMLEITSKVTFEELLKQSYDLIEIEKKIRNFIEIIEKGIV